MSLYDDSAARCYWQIVNSDTLVSTGKGWKLLVPNAQVLDGKSAEALREAAAGDPYELCIRELRLSRPWMEMLLAGTRLVIDIVEWINKTSGRGSITLGIDNEDGNDPAPVASWGVLLGLRSYDEVVPTLFPWAEVSLHTETYDDADDEWFEGDRYVIEAFDEQSGARVKEKLRPYANSAGEVDYWRLELTLNELGQSFLVVDDFAMRPGLHLTPDA